MIEELLRHPNVPAAVGVLWHITDRVAVRPDLSLNRSETTSTLTSTSGATIFGPAVTTTTTSTQTDTTLTGGLSLLVTLADLDDLRIYAAPRVAYLRSETSSEATSPGLAGLGEYTATNDGVTVIGAIGAHYMLDRKSVV